MCKYFLWRFSKRNVKVTINVLCSPHYMVCLLWASSGRSPKWFVWKWCVKRLRFSLMYVKLSTNTFCFPQSIDGFFGVVERIPFHEINLYTWCCEDSQDVPVSKSCDLLSMFLGMIHFFFHWRRRRPDHLITPLVLITHERNIMPRVWSSLWWSQNNMCAKYFLVPHTPRFLPTPSPVSPRFCLFAFLSRFHDHLLPLRLLLQLLHERMDVFKRKTSCKNAKKKMNPTRYFIFCGGGCGGAHFSTQLDECDDLDNDASKLLNGFRIGSKRTVLHQVCHI